MQLCPGQTFSRLRLLVLRDRDPLRSAIGIRDPRTVIAGDPGAGFLILKGKSIRAEFRSQKRTSKPKNHRTAPKNFLNNSRALPNKTRVFRQMAPETSPKSSAESLSQKFSGVPFPSLMIFGKGMRTATFQSSESSPHPSFPE